MGNSFVVAVTALPGGCWWDGKGGQKDSRRILGIPERVPEYSEGSRRIFGGL